MQRPVPRTTIDSGLHGRRGAFASPLHGGAWMEQFPDGVTVLRAGRYAYINPAWQRFAQVAEGALDGHPFVDSFAPEERQSLAAFLASPPGGGPATCECHLVRTEGARLPLEITLADRTGESDDATLLVIGRDLSIRKQLEGQLHMADRLASIGLVTAGIAHEINNPLGCVLANLTFLEESIPREPADERTREMREAVADARDAAERIAGILHGLRTLSHRPEDARAPVSVLRAADAACTLAAHEIRRHARLQREYRTSPLVLGDEARLCQVFLNLLVNAAQCFPARSEANEIRLTVRQEGGAAIVEIHDTGPGIPTDTIAHVFDPFFTTKPAGVGTGLGLPISRRIVEDLGGTLTLESEPGRGTVALVRLPLAGTDAGL